MQSRFPLRATGAALLAAGLLAACGTGNKAEPQASGSANLAAAAAVSAAAEKTIEAKTAKIALSVKESADNSSATGEGIFDAGSGRIQLAIVDDAGEKGDVVFDKETLYFKLPPMEAAEIPGGKPWVEIDLAELSRATDPNLRNLAETADIDPTQSLAFLKGIADDVKEVGKEEIRGAATTHYRGTIDLRKAAEQESDQAKKQVEQALKQAEAEAFPADVWLDKEGRLRKLEYEMPVKVEAGKDKATQHGTVEFYDFGTTASIELPPNDQVLEYEDLVELLKSVQRPAQPSQSTQPTQSTTGQPSAQQPATEQRSGDQDADDKDADKDATDQDSGDQRSTEQQSGQQSGQQSDQQPAQR